MFKKILLPALAVMLAASSLAWAATWYGDYSSEFTNPLNWDTMTVPLNGSLTIKAVPISPISNECTISTHTTQAYGDFYIENGGVFNLQCPDQTGGTSATVAIQFSNSSYINEGTLNVHPTTVSGVGSVRFASTLYVGTGTGHHGTLNILPGASITNSGTPTFGGSSSGAGGTAVINQWGSFWFNQLRLNWNNTGQYTWTLYPGCVVTGGVHATYNTAGDHAAYLNSGIAQGRIVSGVAGYAPVVDYNSVALNTIMTCVRLAKASIPSPANNSTIAGMSAPSQSITLSWTKPLPEDVNQPVTSDVYISTDPNMLVGVTTLGTGIAGNSVSATVSKLQTYYWRVDSTDPNKVVPLTTGDVWTFNTSNTAPAVSISAPYQTTAGDVALWLPGNTSATVSAVVTEDGYPLSGPVTYEWMDDPNNNGTGTVVGTGATVNVTYTEVTPGTTVSNDHRYRLTVSDGELTTVRTFLVRLFVNTCIASPRLPGYVSLTGEFSGDCKVSFADFATFAQNWGLCNAVGGVCN